MQYTRTLCCVQLMLKVTLALRDTSMWRQSKQADGIRLLKPWRLAGEIKAKTPHNRSHSIGQVAMWLYTVGFRNFIVFLLGRDPGTLKSDIAFKKHPQLIGSDLGLSNWKFEDWTYANRPYVGYHIGQSSYCAALHQNHQPLHSAKGGGCSGNRV